MPSTVYKIGSESYFSKLYRFKDREIESFFPLWEFNLNDAILYKLMSVIFDVFHKNNFKLMAFS